MQTLFYGGPILAPEPLAAGTAVLVDGGRITAVGDAGALRIAAPGAQRVNLDGRTLMPALIDAHSHLTQVAYGLLQIDVEGATSPEVLRFRIRSYLRESHIRPGEWVAARGYDGDRMPGAATPRARSSTPPRRTIRLSSTTNPATPD